MFPDYIDDGGRSFNKFFWREADMSDFLGNACAKDEKKMTESFDLTMENVRGVRDPEEWIAFRKAHPDVPIALLIKDIQKQAIVAYRAEVGGVHRI